MTLTNTCGGNLISSQMYMNVDSFFLNHYQKYFLKIVGQFHDIDMFLQKNVQPCHYLEIKMVQAKYFRSSCFETILFWFRSGSFESTLPALILFCKRASLSLFYIIIYLKYVKCTFWHATCKANKCKFWLKNCKIRFLSSAPKAELNLFVPTCNCYNQSF